ncbi:MAG: Mu transposase C-terminal domain-containing protein [Pseudomonadota bacterium]
MSDLPAALNPGDPWVSASEEQRRHASFLESLIKPLAELVDNGASVNNVAALFVSQSEAGKLDTRMRHLMTLVGWETVSVPTIKRALSAYRKEGKTGLLPRYKGRVRQDYGWEVRAVALYNLPGKPGFADVSSRLIQEGFEEATESRVARYLKALPATLGKFSPARVGPHLHKLRRQKFQRRSLDEVLVGEIYAGDGHTCDCYVGHPNTGKPFRPELTAFIDIKSGYVAGFWFTESESSVSTLFALSYAMRANDHVPAWVYVDRGAGYRSKMLADEATGYYARFDIGMIGALPGNPHGKGWIERWFRTVRDKHDKFFAGGQVYCGDDMAAETNRRLSADLNKKEPTRTLPSLREYVASFRTWLEHYHNQPQDKLGGCSPAQVWAGLKRVSVELDMSSVIRPREEVTVGRQTVRLHNRFYFNEALALFDAKKLHAEYDLHDDSRVWLFDTKGAFLMEALLVDTIGVLPTSRLEEGRDRRAAGQLKRLERKVEEVRQRRADPIDAETQIRAIESLDSLRPALPTAEPVKSADIYDIDLTTWRKDQ